MGPLPTASGTSSARRDRRGPDSVGADAALGWRPVDAQLGVANRAGWGRCALLTRAIRAEAEGDGVRDGVRDGVGDGVGDGVEWRSVTLVTESHDGVDAGVGRL